LCNGIIRPPPHREQGAVKRERPSAREEATASGISAQRFVHCDIAAIICAISRGIPLILPFSLAQLSQVDGQRGSLP